ncbi:MAG: HNH endonuclease signature motif containing protein [Candidatus Kaistia colombiensis]|nr:MAG: HNH endonuclease signature motif containing protein [Kaistia sp.]
MQRSSPGTPVAERIRQNVEVDPSTGCWNWTKHIKPDGYGRLSIDGRMPTAHRASYEDAHGKVPPGLDVDHLCRNRRCVNPAHLEAVDRRENVLRGISFAAVNAAKTHCVRGHPFNEANTGHRGNARVCRRCSVIHSLAYRKRKSA